MSNTPVPYSQILQQGLQRPAAPLHVNAVRETAFRNPFSSASTPPHPQPPGNSVHGNQPFAEGGENYTWATSQQKYAPNGRLFHSKPAAVPTSNATASRQRGQVNNIVPHHQPRLPRCTTIQYSNPIHDPHPHPHPHPHSHPHPHPHSHPHSQDRKQQSPKLDNHGTESPSNADYRTPRHVTPQQSRRGSAVCANGPLQCHYKNCPKRFATDREWREHKPHCRYRDYQMTSGFQCSFVECRGSPSLEATTGADSNQSPPAEDGPQSPSITYLSLLELLAHEREHHQVLWCIDCQHVFLGSETDRVKEHRQTCTAQNTGRSYPSKYAGFEIGLGLQKSFLRGDACQKGKKIHQRWVKDIHKALSHQDRQGGADLVDLTYPERCAEERGEQSERSTAEGLGDPEGDNPPATLSETARSAMAKHLIGTLKLHNEYLRTASDVVLELTLGEKDEVRENLTSLANLLRIELNTAGSSTLSLARENNMSHRRSVSTPAIEISTEAVSTSTGPLTYAQTVRTGLQPPKDESWADETEGILNPSNEPEKFQIKPQCILSRSNSPSRGASAPPAPATAGTQSSPESSASMNLPPQQAESRALEPNLPMSALRRVGTNTIVRTTEEGEPLQDIHIPREEQLEYFVQMMNCCLEAVYEWFVKNREVLLENCECTILNAANTGDASQGTQASEGCVDANPCCAALTKGGKKKQKKRFAAAAADAGVPLTTNKSGTPGDSTPTKPPMCLLHTVTSVKSLNLPRWTHHLRRLVEHGRIPSSIISNRDSFSGEIQPVDEVRHAVNKQKEKTDRDLLALVQQARRFCWQLKDWERCRQLDELYTLLEQNIKLVKEEEENGWELAESKKGSMRGRRYTRDGRTDTRRVVTTLAPTGSVVGDTSGDDAVGSTRKSLVRQSRTWPRMLGSDEPLG